jgi:sterol desaturase/sphingolipid hydroxylase (fatty acid hydroxylase superfamily)
MANIFSVWDRLFGTYIAPDTVKGELTFGIEADENPIRVILGV